VRKKGELSIGWKSGTKRSLAWQLLVAVKIDELCRIMSLAI